MARSLEQITDQSLAVREEDLARIRQATLAIEQATTIEEAARYRNEAELLEGYFRNIQKSEILAARCNQIKLNAERKAGEMLRRLNLTPGPSGPSLSDLDISRNQSSKWQKLAGIPPEVWDDAIEESPSERELLRLADRLAEPEPEPSSEPEPRPQPEPNQAETPGYWVLSEGEGLTKVSDAAGVPVVALLDGDGVVVGYFLDHALAEQMAVILNAM